MYSFFSLPLFLRRWMVKKWRERRVRSSLTEKDMYIKKVGKESSPCLTNTCSRVKNLKYASRCFFSWTSSSHSLTLFSLLSCHSSLLFMFHCPRLHSITTFFHFFSCCLPQSVNSYTPLFNFLLKREIFQREDGIQRDARVSVISSSFPLTKKERRKASLSLYSLSLFVSRLSQTEWLLFDSERLTMTVNRVKYDQRWEQEMMMIEQQEDRGGKPASIALSLFSVQHKEMKLQSHL